MRGDAPQWVETVRAFVDAPGSIVVAGEDAGPVARSLGLAFGLALITEEIGFGLLGADHPEANRVRDLPDDSVDVVIFRRPWKGRVEAGGALKAAARVLKPGGRVFAGERELDALTKTSALSYPIGAFVEADPAVLRADLKTSVGRIGIAADVVRTGFKQVEAIDIDEHRGEYADAAAFIAAFVDEDMSGAFESVDRAYRNRPVADIDPWVYATGVKV